FSWTQQPRRAVLIGGGRAAAALAQTLMQEAPKDYQIIGYVPSATEPDPHMAGFKQLGTGADLPQMVQHHGVSELILAHDSPL
ncbi:MAG: hypothetical protein CUN49_19655, partial [Candidatus Thermofonsia Clade 1 bacterium]